ncbi:FAD binding domain-containing protein [Syncephalis plumigaleata]|nr:FAD binding domain-containing protein [Syncephalis plumigaleata]
MDVNLQANVHHPVIIIGAGPVGLMAGIILTEAGVPIEIYERRFEGMNELRASVIHPRILEMLDFYGLIDRFIKAGNPFTKLSTYIKGKFISFLDIERVRSKYSFMLGCGQVITEALLQEKLIELGIKVKRGWQYISHTVMEDAAYVDVRLKRVDSEEMVERHASYVIGCDGGHSSVRKTIGVEFNAQSLGSKVCVCDVELDAEWLPASCFIVDNDGYGGVIRARKERQYRLFMDCYTERPNCTDEEVIATFKRRYYPYNVERMRILSISYFSPNECRASKYISDDKRVFLCGDAAHVHSPMGAQGMNTGLQDAENLAWKVGMVYNGLAKPELLKSYATERIPIADAVINHSRGLSSIAKRPWKFLLLTRVLRFMQYLPNVWSRPLLEKNAQLRVKYASSEHYGIFPDTPAWKRASSSWFPFWYFSDPLCSPGTRAINCQVIDANTITYTHINRFFANNKKSYTALIVA